MQCVEHRPLEIAVCLVCFFVYFFFHLKLDSPRIVRKFTGDLKKIKINSIFYAYSHPFIMKLFTQFSNECAHDDEV